MIILLGGDLPETMTSVSSLPKLIVTICAVTTILLGSIVLAMAPAQALRHHPRPQRECGTIKLPKGHSVHVDIAHGAEGSADCHAARRVMSQFLIHGKRTFHAYGHDWLCRAPHPKSQNGWKYHCTSHDPQAEVMSYRVGW